MSGNGEMVVNPEAKEARIGVFVCHCGSNIAGLLDCVQLTEYAAGLPGVVYTKNNLYTCSESGIGEIKKAIGEHQLTRVVVASCSPRTHMPLFKSACDEAGLNPYLFEMANIRDQCSWVHMQQGEDAMVKARDLIRMAVAKASLLAPQKDIESSLVRKALVIGGGVTGLSAACALADMGVEVVLAERETRLGGLLSRINRLAPSGEKASDLVGELVSRVTGNDRIRTLLGAEVLSVGGLIGNYHVTLRSGEGKEFEETVGCILVATGAVPLKPEAMYGYNGKEVVTQIELEEMLRDGSLNARKVVMIQCAGSRVPEREYCSRICCLTAVKNALYIKERNPEAQVHILYRDIQMYGTENERMLWESRGKGVRYDVYDGNCPPVVKGNTVEVCQPLTGDVLEIPFDLLVLSTPLVAREDAAVLANLMRIPVDQNRFFLEAHAKLRPLDFATDGIFLCGTARYPATVGEAQAQGFGAASRAATVLFKDKLISSALISRVTEHCDGCALCVDVCPYYAIKLEEHERDGRRVKRIVSDEILCKGCGVCAATCPKGGVEVNGFTLDQLKAQVDAALEAV